MNIRVLRSARRTIADGIKFYESQQSGLGAYFLTSIMSDLRSLKIYGGGHQVYEGTEYHRMVCTRFPYSIYYKKQDQQISVFAILDDRRNPKWIDEVLGKVEP